MPGQVNWRSLIPVLETGFTKKTDANGDLYYEINANADFVVEFNSPSSCIVECDSLDGTGLFASQWSMDGINWYDVEIATSTGSLADTFTVISTSTQIQRFYCYAWNMRIRLVYTNTDNTAGTFVIKVTE